MRTRFTMAIQSLPRRDGSLIFMQIPKRPTIS